jgi:hypothetical protein
LNFGALEKQTDKAKVSRAVGSINESIVLACREKGEAALSNDHGKYTYWDEEEKQNATKLRQISDTLAKGESDETKPKPEGSPSPSPKPKKEAAAKKKLPQRIIDRIIAAYDPGVSRVTAPPLAAEPAAAPPSDVPTDVVKQLSIRPKSDSYFR